jgi:hypothetical protein
MTVEIIEVKSKKQLQNFIQFPGQLYKGDPYFVPALYLSEEWILSKKNPFLHHSQITLFLAKENKKTVGRIAAIYNKTHLEVYNDNTGFFGFFDAINNVEVAQALFKASSDWLKSIGLTIMIGPTNLTTNDSCGFLTNTFDQSSMVLMPYNFEYYNKLCLDCGFKKMIDLYSYEVDGTAVVIKYANILKRSLLNMESNGIKIRPVSANSFNEDINQLRLVYNKSNENNWGFMPLNIAEFKAMAKDLKMITPLDLALVVEKGEKIIGYIIAVPNFNQALKHVANGKLLPFGFLKLLWYKRKISSARIMILGMLNEYSGLGIDLVLYQKIKEALNNHNIFISEACYILESNNKMNSILKKVEGRRIKTYRMYQIEVPMFVI